MIDSVDFITAANDPGGNPLGLPAAWPVIQVDSDSGTSAPVAPWQRLSQEDFDAYLAAHQADYDVYLANVKRLALIAAVRLQAISWMNTWYDAYHLIRMQIFRLDDTDASAPGKALVLSVRTWIDSIDTYVGTLIATLTAGTLVSPDFDANVGNPPYTYNQVYFAVKTPTFTGQPNNATVLAPLAASFSVTTTGYSTRTYCWQRSNDGGTTWANIVGATSATYTLTPTATGDNGAKFRCKCQTSAYAVATSNVATLTVL